MQVVEPCHFDPDSQIVTAISDINAPLPLLASIHVAMLRFPCDGNTEA